ncbi:MAG TPA: patatin-like phospholipase family protein [Leptospiraceae bacterium]|nr:patatin-like phospholipase family protein [Leptospirales bacterium]HMU81903.1 patatin-like phospholipase family protein [Leptospiraceae bacterium]HMW58084.1 patatin-like phospholipase family protein [Leptospiraceae bacterium]HMX55816.1 patatin-like phospholipase family protein [Leptospiraceae bacterium]HNE24068.1 patatin-like phospholipase family protein [Leptospiraceae bacterium]
MRLFGNWKFGRRPRIGVALGSGAARGWAHIGVLRCLEMNRIPVDVVAGCSAGAVIGAFYAARAMTQVEKFALMYKGVRDTFKYLDFSPRSGGLVQGKNFIKFLEEHLPVRNFSELKMPFGVVATDLVHMEEVHISDGPLLPAIRASVAVPGFLSPLESRSPAGEVRQLVDGGLLNPVPVSLCRKLGADIVIAVDLNSEKFHEPAKSMTDIMARSIDAMREVHKRNNFNFYPADVLVEPHMPEFGFFDYHRTQEAIDIGSKAAEEKLDRIKRLL